MINTIFIKTNQIAFNSGVRDHFHREKFFLPLFYIRDTFCYKIHLQCN